MDGIRINNLVKKFDNCTIGGLNFGIKEGEYFVLLGPSGSGKTVTIEMISGVSRPDSGSVIGVEKKKTGLIYQDYMLFPHMNVYDNISYGLRMKKFSRKIIEKKVNAIAEKFGISHILPRQTDGLSGGEKQRVAIARAMILKPDIYFLDEPTSSLDRNLKRKARDFFRKIHKESKKIFIHVTHDFEEALSLGDRIGILFDGKLVQIGTPEELYASPVSGEVADFIGYRNVWSGKISNFTFRKNGIAIGVPVENCLSAYIAVRPDDIIISNRKIDSSARNTFEGTVDNIVTSVSTAEVSVDVGVPVSIEITRQSLSELKIKKGGRVFITFKVSSVKVFER